MVAIRTPPPWTHPRSAPENGRLTMFEVVASRRVGHCKPMILRSFASGSTPPPTHGNPRVWVTHALKSVSGSIPNASVPISDAPAGSEDLRVALRGIFSNAPQADGALRPALRRSPARDQVERQGGCFLEQPRSVRSTWSSRRWTSSPTAAAGRCVLPARGTRAAERSTQPVASGALRCALRPRPGHRTSDGGS